MISVLLTFANLGYDYVTFTGPRATPFNHLQNLWDTRKDKVDQGTKPAQMLAQNEKGQDLETVICKKKCSI